MTFKIIKHLSEEYGQMVQLRTNVLLLPSGISPAYIQPQHEGADVHIGAFEGTTIIGCCVLTGRGEGLVQLRQMAVETTEQSKGLGRGIVGYAEKVAREQGFTVLYLHARNSVIPFYKKCGYEIAGAEFFEVGLGHHRMEKVL